MSCFACGIGPLFPIAHLQHDDLERPDFQHVANPRPYLPKLLAMSWPPLLRLKLHRCSRQGGQPARA
jgi:hypothetical protein